MSGRKDSGQTRAAAGWKALALSLDAASGSSAGAAPAAAAAAVAATDSKRKSKGKAAAATAAAGAELPVARYLYFKEHTAKAKKKRVRVTAPDADGDADADADADPNDAEDELTPGATLFVANIPHHFELSDVREAFSVFGEVAAVYFAEPLAAGGAVPVTSTATNVAAAAASPFGAAAAAPRTRCAHVVFDGGDDGLQGAACVQRACGTATAELCAHPQPYTAGGVAAGLNKWMAEYKAQRPDPKRMQLQVDRFMQLFDARSEAEKRAAKAGPIVDADGFTLVVAQKPHRSLKAVAAASATAAAAAAAAGAADAAAALEESNTLDLPADAAAAGAAGQLGAALTAGYGPVKGKKKQKSAPVNFYRFQERQQKRDQLALLRAKFEEDKKRVAKMKAQRKFKPY